MIDALKLMRGRPSVLHGGKAKLYAIVVDGKVVNITRWDAGEHPEWRPAVGDAVPCDAAVAIGNTWDGSAFNAPAVVAHVGGQRRPSLRQEIEAIKQRLDALEKG